MKFVFWFLIVMSAILSYVLWFAPSERQALHPPPPPLVKAQPPEGKTPSRLERKSLEVKKPELSEEELAMSVKLSFLARVREEIGSWLATLSKGVPVVTTGLAVWVRVADRKKKRKKRR